MEWFFLRKHACPDPPAHIGWNLLFTPPKKTVSVEPLQTASEETLRICCLWQWKYWLTDPSPTRRSAFKLLCPWTLAVGLIASWHDCSGGKTSGRAGAERESLCRPAQEFLVAVGLRGATLQHRVLPSGLSWHEQVRARVRLSVLLLAHGHSRAEKSPDPECSAHGSSRREHFPITTSQVRT